MGIALTAINKLISTVFLVELALKIIARGMYWNGKNSYCSHPWRVIDGLLILAGMITYIDYFSVGYHHQSYVLVVRVPRVINILFKNRSMKAALISLYQAFPALIKLGVFVFINLLVLAVIGIQFKRGFFYYCDTHNISLDVTIETKQDCMDYGGDWVNNDNNFDNIGNALNVLFQMCTAVTWEKKT